MSKLPTRRALLLSIPFIATVPVAGQISARAVDPHPEWMEIWRANRARWKALAVLPSNPNWDDPRSLECDRIQAEMERRLAGVPATTLAGAIACLSWIEEEMDAEEWAFKGHRDAFENAMSALRAIESSS